MIPLVHILRKDYKLKLDVRTLDSHYSRSVLTTLYIHHNPNILFQELAFKVSAL